MTNEDTSQVQTQGQGRQSQSQVNNSRKPDPRKPDAPVPQSIPGDDPGTLSDEDYLGQDGSDELDAADDPHPDSRPDSRRDKAADPERSGGAPDRSQSI
jgi:hypothetical protein